MGPDFLQRFFKLTLDNVYRFTCSLLFVVAVSAHLRHVSPVTQLGSLLDWLAIPSAWLTTVGAWVDDRQSVVGFFAALVLCIALAFAAANDWHSRSGSTALLCTATLTQVGMADELIAVTLSLVAGLAVVTVTVAFVARRWGWGMPEWTASAWGTLWNVLLTLGLAALSLLSPLGWLISQERHDVRGTRSNPLVVEQVGRAGPSGAVGR
ncbi:hypothetical protein [Microbacterium sp.]|uniref:hypothetical protein n=1 Tax=Microbacterium sp. TaxID=51671 RepID=UPI0039E593C1